jgi:hypothetical protein
MRRSAHESHGIMVTACTKRASPWLGRARN